MQLIPNGQHLRVSFSVHRKDICTGKSIAHDSTHPPAHKMAVINHAIHRLIKLPLLAQAIAEETRTIQLIADKNGLNVDIPLTIRKKRLRILLSGATPRGQNDDPISLRIKYLGDCSNKISSELKRMDYRVGFYPLITLNHPVNLKDPIPKNKRSVIYR